MIKNKHNNSIANKTLSIPFGSLWMVVEVAMEYDLYSLPDFPKDNPPLVLDVGANVGIFAINALQRWPGATVMSYEPHPETFRLLSDNVSDLPNAGVANVAIVGSDIKSKSTILHEGARNRLCCSLIDRGDQDMETSSEVRVDVLPAQELPACDVLKMDTEGCEVPILEAYGQEKLGKVKFLLAEIHADKDYAPIDKMARAAGLTFLDRRKTTVRYAR